jgi:hypothetical protein
MHCTCGIFTFFYIMFGGRAAGWVDKSKWGILLLEQFNVNIILHLPWTNRIIDHVSRIL